MTEPCAFLLVSLSPFAHAQHVKSERFLCADLEHKSALALAAGETRDCFRVKLTTTEPDEKCYFRFDPEGGDLATSGAEIRHNDLAPQKYTHFIGFIDIMKSRFPKSQYFKRHVIKMLTRTWTKYTFTTLYSKHHTPSNVCRSCNNTYVEFV